MDLNPQIPDWTAAEGPYELADYAIANKANVLLLLNAWLDSGKELDEPNDWHTLNYWAARTRPLWTDGKGDASSDEEDHEPDPETAESGDETIVVICNRSGEENGALRPQLSFLVLMNSLRPNVCRNIRHIQHATRFRTPKIVGHDGKEGGGCKNMEYPCIILPSVYYTSEVILGTRHNHLSCFLSLLLDEILEDSRRQ